ncbi:sedoheptulose 7-phosphate cyclase [Maribacter sp. 2-571]|uniref:sedoheptulose 7-phosphate cyclase n=1 Tax=Maribacter sp. 2-571 TaxID=3417569 RepID=UPI003D330B8A
MEGNTVGLNIQNLLGQVEETANISVLVNDASFLGLLEQFRKIDAFSLSLATELGHHFGSNAIFLLRKLRSAYAMPIRLLIPLVSQFADIVNPKSSDTWTYLKNLVSTEPEGASSVASLILKYGLQNETKSLIAELEKSDPHAIYPTSPYRESKGTVSTSLDDKHIEAVMTTSTMTEIHISEGVLQVENTILKNLYQPLGRCICVLDSNISEHYRDDIVRYFRHFDIALNLLVYRAMEVDKGIGMVEELLSDFKRVGVSRQEPVLIVGGGVIADIGGLACSLYHRNTPYVMLATSIVSGIDAGPSPRTCCDGFGFKNLFGAYHAPVMTLTDRTFFKTLRTGWVRHGIAEIIKMAVVKDSELFELLEETGIDLVYSQFGTLVDDNALGDRSQRILALAMRSYVQAEYDNLYETHQCRPHAYGHTWSPGYEIPSGMLHGHAVACGMGFGAYLSYREGWISEHDRNRILSLIGEFELSLWHPILDNTDLVYQAQIKVIEKRGGNLVAPLPKGKIGDCGYLNKLSYEELKLSLLEYKVLCKTFKRNGLGVDAHCHEVGLEDPSTVVNLNLANRVN